MSTDAPAAIPSADRRGRLRGLLANAALAVTSVIVVFGGAEVLLRYAGFTTRGTWSAPCYQPIPEIGHLFIPGFRGTMYKGISSRWQDVAIRINAHGLRGAEFPLAKPPGLQRVLVLGDSFAFGYLLPEEDAYPSQLQGVLDAHRGANRVQVINAGVPGYGIDNQAALLEYRGLAFEPDVVVVTASPGDVADAGSRKGPDSGNDHTDMDSELRLYHLVQTSALMNLMQYLFLASVVMTDPKITLDRGLHATTLSQSVRRALDRYEQQFAHLAQIAQQRGLPVLFAAYPGQLELFSDNTVVHERWRTLATSHGAGFVDVLPAFKAERRQDLYLPADGHTTREANRLMAEAIATALQSILPAR